MLVFLPSLRFQGLVIVFLQISEVYHRLSEDRRVLIKLLSVVPQLFEFHLVVLVEDSFVLARYLFGQLPLLPGRYVDDDETFLVF